MGDSKAGARRDHKREMVMTYLCNGPIDTKNARMKSYSGRSRAISHVMRDCLALLAHNAQCKSTF